MDGSRLAPTTPKGARRLVKNSAARWQLDQSTGTRWLQMVAPCGNVLPPVLAQPGTALPLQP